MLPGVAVETSPWRAFTYLTWFSMRRHVRIRQMAGVAIALLLIVIMSIAVFTHGPIGWRLEKRHRKVISFQKDAIETMTFDYYGRSRLPVYEGLPGSPEAFGIKAAVFGSYNAIVNNKEYLDDYAFLNFSRSAIFALYIGFVLPLLTLAYATSAFGAERESRTLLWLLTRPLPRWAIYLAKLLGVLPWCVGISVLALVMICLAGGELGRTALKVYWPTALAGSVAFTALFHLIGAIFRRPSIVSLGYVFFYESLVGTIPGSLKMLSLNFYVRSVFYAETAPVVKHLRPESLSVFAPVEAETAWFTLLFVTLGLTALGMFLFSRQEPQEET